MKATRTFGKIRTAAITIGIVMSSTASAQTLQPPELTALEELGKHAFFDTTLSKPKGQGCVSCHDPASGWTFPDSVVNDGPVVAPGAIWHRSGGIKTPGNSYISSAPVFQRCSEIFGGNRGAPAGGRYCGGMFWDGRAEGYGKEGWAPKADGALSDTVTPADLPESVREAYTEYLGPLADQALNPFPNSVEQNIDPKHVCKRISRGDYAHLYKEVFGERINCKTKPNSNPAYITSFKRIAVALSAYQASPDVNSFTSKRDIALYRELACLTDGNEGEFVEFWDADFCNQDKGAPWGEFPLLELSAQENRGHDLFYGLETASNEPEPVLDEGGNETGEFTTTNAGCHRCHNDNPLADDGTEPFQTYNDHGYHGIGLPFNREIPGAVPGVIDGVISHVSYRADNGEAVEPGFFKNPSVRNVAKGEGEITKAYGHNGYFKSLKGIVHFYSTRDLKRSCGADRIRSVRGVPTLIAQGLNLDIEHPTEEEALANNCWPLAEFQNSEGNFADIGILNLTDEQEDALVAYMMTLSDQYTPEAP
ncbi:MAG: cytochrome c peroxidase [Halioglobus sp.]